ncbi:MAG: alpha/beta fold hydrolase [Tabrizicola sp.]|nr:alpha/beta fold hydrolase [Tabrizicola sp.]
MLKSVMLAAAVAVTATAAAADCADTAGACKIALGEYHIMLPEGATAKTPAVMFLHGYGGDGAGVYRNKGMTDAILARGYALIAPSGRDRDGSEGKRWSFHPDRPETRDETAFLRQVLDDAAARFGIDRERVLLSGFSIGGSMVAYAACEDPTLAAAYAPVSGNFWRPHPDRCAGPVRMLHTHGWTDTTVPLEGRFLGGTAGRPRIAQGDVFEAMRIWRETNSCDEMRADAFAVDGSFWHRRWDRCTPGSALELVLFPGTHAVPKGWAGMALDWFEAL